MDRVKRKSKSVLRTIPNQYEDDQRPQQMSKIQSQNRLNLGGGAMSLVNGIHQMASSPAGHRMQRNMDA